MKIEKLEYYSSSKDGYIWQRHPNIDDITNKINEIIDKLNERDNAEPVARCKDCILDREAQCPMKYGTDPDDYCSFGERIDEVNE